MDKNKLLPSLDAINHISTATGEVLEARYMTGHPRQYRFDASKGIVNINGEEPVTKPGKEFRFRLVALRIFKSNLFERGRNVWAELFFLNCANQLCSITVHGYSVENLERLQSELFYDDLRIDEVILTMKPVGKTSKASGNAFYIAEFEYTAAPSDLVHTQNLAVEGLQIYRADTVKEDEDILVNLNYYELPKLEAPDTDLEDLAALPQAAGGAQ
jgi:hypothetical protein